MRKIGEMETKEREVLFRSTAAKMGISEAVIEKKKFYRCPWAHYDIAKRGTMRLMPPEYNIPKLRDDYEHMQNMIFGEEPSFDTILSETQKLENDINQVGNRLEKATRIMGVCI